MLFYFSRQKAFQVKRCFLYKNGPEKQASQNELQVVTSNITSFGLEKNKRTTWIIRIILYISQRGIYIINRKTCHKNIFLLL